MSSGASAAHGDVGEELRLLALALLDRFEPGVRSVLAGLRVEADAAPAGDGQQRPVACQWCPLCTVIALVRGEAPELGGRLAEHGEALLSVLRTGLEQPRPPAADQPSPSLAPPSAPSPPAPQGPGVQRIEVVQVADDDGRADRGGPDSG